MNFEEGLNFYGWNTPFGGYAIVAMELAIALNKLTGDKVSYGWERRMPGSDEGWLAYTPEQRYIISEKPYKPERIGIIKTTPDRFNENKSVVRIGYTMVENTKIGKQWVKLCNQMSAIFVPSPFLVEVFSDCGVRVPIYAVKQGIDVKKFPYKDREKKNKFVFGTNGWLDDRKNWKMLVQAFCSEFDKDEPVELWLKNSNEIFGFERCPDKRVKFIDKLLNFDDLLQFYYDLDCFVFPSKAEGAGMPPREAMSTGLPVIMTNWSGLKDICNSKFNYPIEPIAIDEVEADFRKISQPGNQARVDVAELMYWMRYVYEHQDEAKEKGKLASEFIKKEYSVEACASGILDILIRDFNYK